MPDFGQFEKNIGISFNDKGLLRQAFVHRSYINENRDAGFGHNERLEFLGDAVLELVITDYLFRKYPDKTEGELTAYRSSLVNATTLAGVATTLTMNDFLILSRGEAKDTGRARQVILANTIEALIGAIYIDQGYDIARDFIYTHISPLIDSVIAEGSWIDSKSLFQERAQDVDGVTPVYKTTKEAGPDHDKKFTVGVYIKDKMIATGEGKSKQDAEQEAAKKGLEVRRWV